MRRDWPLAGAGLGLMIVSGSLAFAAFSADDPTPSCRSQAAASPVAVDGCGQTEPWIASTGIQVTLALALLFLLAALYVIRRGLTSPLPH